MKWSTGHNKKMAACLNYDKQAITKTHNKATERSEVLVAFIVFLRFTAALPFLCFMVMDCKKNQRRNNTNLHLGQ